MNDDNDTDDEPEVAKGHNPIVWQQQSDRRFVRRAETIYGDEKFLAPHNVKFKEG